jgi:hypothetical protein
MIERVTHRLFRPRLSSAFLLGLVLGGCAGPGRGAGGYNPNIISADEIREMHGAGVRDLYELVNRERPRWLQTRTERSLQLPTTVLVYVNETRLGGTDALRGYPLQSVSSLRYLDAAQAMLLPGAGSAHIDGAIVINTRARAVDTSTAQVSLPSPDQRRGYP